MIYTLIGATCSGKTTALKQLVELGFNSPASYTTRPQRKGEVEGVDYYFISKQQYDRLDEANLLTAKNSFKNAFESEWFYGLGILDVDTDLEDLVVIVEPKGYRDLVETFGIDHIVGIYLNTPYDVRLLRGLNRSDNLNELMRRLVADEKDFKGFEKEVEHVIVGLEKQEILDKVLSIINGGSQK